MTKLIVEMELPQVCITKDGYYGNCPMDRVWCIQRNAPSGTKMRDAYAEMTDNIPSWCPIKGVLPDEHGDLIDRTLLYADLVGVILSHSGLNFSEVLARQNAVIAAERKDET